MFFIRLGCENDSRNCCRMCRKHNKYRGSHEFTLFQLCSELDAVQSCFGCLFVSFLNTLGSLFLICEGLGGMVEIRSFYKGDGRTPS